MQDAQGTQGMQRAHLEVGESASRDLPEGQSSRAEEGAVSASWTAWEVRPSRASCVACTRARGACVWRCGVVARRRIIWLRQRLWIARRHILWRILRRLWLLFSPQMRRRVRRHVREIRSVVEREGWGRGGRRSSQGS